MSKLLRRRFRRVLIDVDTQYDLLYQLEYDYSNLLRNIRRLFAWARVHHIPIISTALIRRPVSCPDLMTDHKDFCIENTPGQKKVRYTMLSSNVMFGPDNCMDLPRHILTDYQQVIFEKRSDDPFLQLRADRLLSEFKADEFIVFGIGLHNSVKYTILGLLCRGKNTRVLTDAVDCDNTRHTIMTFRKMEAKGAKMSTTSELVGHSRLNGKIGNLKPWHSPLLINARIG